MNVGNDIVTGLLFD